jgi:hypothetical protein
MKNDSDDKNIIPSEKRDITHSDSSLAKRGLELLSKPTPDDIIQYGERISAANISNLTKIALFNVGQYFEKHTFPDGKTIYQSGYPYCIDISQDNQYLATGLINQEIRLWQIIHGSHPVILKGHCVETRFSRVKYLG